MILEPRTGASVNGNGAPVSQAVADLELQLLLEGVYRVTGYDFREYAPAT